MISNAEFNDLKLRLVEAHKHLMDSMREGHQRDLYYHTQSLLLEKAKNDAYNSGQITGSNETIRKAQLTQLIQAQIDKEAEAELEAEKGRFEIALDAQEYKFAVHMLELYQLLKE